MMKRSELITMIMVFIFFGYIIFTILKRRKLEEKILKNGVFDIAVVKERVRSNLSSKTYIYIYYANGILFEKSDFMNPDLSMKYKKGDTIMIKYLLSDPKKSMILEDIEYKTCFGIPPSNGWKEKPNCK